MLHHLLFCIFTCIIFVSISSLKCLNSLFVTFRKIILTSILLTFICSRAISDIGLDLNCCLRRFFGGCGIVTSIFSLITGCRGVSGAISDLFGFFIFSYLQYLTVELNWHSIFSSGQIILFLTSFPSLFFNIILFSYSFLFLLLSNQMPIFHSSHSMFLLIVTTPMFVDLTICPNSQAMSINIFHYLYSLSLGILQVGSPILMLYITFNWALFWQFGQVPLYSKCWVMQSIWKTWPHAKDERSSVS